MRLCTCPRPVRDGHNPDRLRCFACAGWTPHGKPGPTHRTRASADEMRSLLAKLCDDWPYAFDLAHQPRLFPTNGHTPGHSNPTVGQAVNEQRQTTAAYLAVATRLLERALNQLRLADEAIGDALLAAETPGPADHTPAPFHDPASCFPGRPDLQEAHAAQGRRRNRGDL